MNNELFDIDKIKKVLNIVYDENNSIAVSLLSTLPQRHERMKQVLEVYEEISKTEKFKKKYKISQALRGVLITLTSPGNIVSPFQFTNFEEFKNRKLENAIPNVKYSEVHQIEYNLIKTIEYLIFMQQTCKKIKECFNNNDSIAYSLYNVVYDYHMLEQKNGAEQLLEKSAQICKIEIPKNIATRAVMDFFDKNISQAFSELKNNMENEVPKYGK